MRHISMDCSVNPYTTASVFASVHHDMRHISMDCSVNPYTTASVFASVHHDMRHISMDCSVNPYTTASVCFSLPILACVLCSLALKKREPVWTHAAAEPPDAVFVHNAKFLFIAIQYMQHTAMRHGTSDFNERISLFMVMHTRAIVFLHGAVTQSPASAHRFRRIVFDFFFAGRFVACLCHKALPVHLRCVQW